MTRAKILLTAILLPILAAAGSAQAPADPVLPAERMWIAGKLYAAVGSHFGHWSAVPDLDLDSAYRAYVEEALRAEDRFAFDLASMAFLAQLRNGHTDFNDPWLWQTRGQPVGFRLEAADASWVVVESRVPRLTIGDVVVAIDGEDVGAFVTERGRYVSASDPVARVRMLFFRAFLFPETFDLLLADGRVVRIDRRAQVLDPAPSRAMRQDTVGQGIPYLAVPGFDDPAMERAAVAFVVEHGDAPALIIDVRANGGGTTPIVLIEALMDRPYRDFTEATSFSIALYSAYRQVGRIAGPGQLTDYVRGLVDAFAGYEHPELRWPGTIHRPADPVFSGRVAILADNGCASACEDFLLPFKTSGRGAILGERTRGSTGQPFLYSFDNGMSFRVSTKRVYFPDGSPFEGVGIAPDVEVVPTIDDLRAGRDPVLDRAIDLLSGGS
jgi:carboxyl-terminal processing protease